MVRRSGRSVRKTESEAEGQNALPNKGVGEGKEGNEAKQSDSGKEGAERSLAIQLPELVDEPKTQLVNGEATFS